MGGFRLGNIFGINIIIDWSWIFIFLLVTWNLSAGVFPALHPDWSAFLNWILGVTTSILFFASVLAHELAHSLVAKSRGLPVNQIVLFLFGGVSNIEREPQSANTEFLMAIVGPLTSMALGVIFVLLGGAALGNIGNLINNPIASLAGLDPLPTLFLWLGLINILVGFFNLIPGFPLDGGRVLRAFIWSITNNLRLATRLAVGVGQFVAWLFILAGISMIFGIRFPIIGGGIIGGIWLAFIGFFLNSAARASFEEVEVRSTLQNFKVADLMQVGMATVSPDNSVTELVHDYIMGTQNHAFLVMENDKFMGIVTLEDVRKVSRIAWDRSKVSDIMTTLNKLITVEPEESLTDALQKLVSQDVGQLPVMKDGKLVGILNRRDILLWLQLHSQKGLERNKDV